MKKLLVAVLATAFAASVFAQVPQKAEPAVKAAKEEKKKDSTAKAKAKQEEKKAAK